MEQPSSRHKARRAIVGKLLPTRRSRSSAFGVGELSHFGVTIKGSILELAAMTILLSSLVSRSEY